MQAPPGPQSESVMHELGTQPDGLRFTHTSPGPSWRTGQGPLEGTQDPVHEDDPQPVSHPLQLGRVVVVVLGSHPARASEAPTRRTRRGAASENLRTDDVTMMRPRNR